MSVRDGNEYGTRKLPQSVSLTRGSTRGLSAGGALRCCGLLLGLFLPDIGLVMTDGAPDSRSSDRVMSGDMAGDGADGGPLDAPFGATHAGQYGDCGQERRGNRKFAHLNSFK